MKRGQNEWLWKSKLTFQLSYSYNSGRTKSYFAFRLVGASTDGSELYLISKPAAIQVRHGISGWFKNWNSTQWNKKIDIIVVLSRPGSDQPLLVPQSGQCCGGKLCAPLSPRQITYLHILIHQIQWTWEETLEQIWPSMLGDVKQSCPSHGWLLRLAMDAGCPSFSPQSEITGVSTRHCSLWELLVIHSRRFLAVGWWSYLWFDKSGSLAGVSCRGLLGSKRLANLAETETKRQVPIGNCTLSNSYNIHDSVPHRDQHKHN